MLLLFKKPDRHEGAEVTVVTVVAQEHLGCRQGCPFGDGIHLDGVGLFVGQLAGVKIIPGDVGAHVPTYGFHRFEQFGIKHSVSLSRLVASMARLPLCCCIAVKTMADYTTAYRFVGRCMPA